MKGAPTLEAVEPVWAESCITEQDGLTVIALVWPERPITMNENRNMHFRVERQHIKHWRGTFSRLAEQCPRLAWATLTVHHEVGRRILPDFGACMPSVKWALDGCRDWTDTDERSPTYGTEYRGILPDDCSPYLRGLTFAQPVYTGRYALTLEFRGEPAPSAPNPD